jgi:hypothetical protein
MMDGKHFPSIQIPCGGMEIEEMESAFHSCKCFLEGCKIDGE